jgi:tRNA-dihydrouridine synthase B
LQVGPVRIDSPVVLAPMTGVSDLPFRTMVRRFGSGLNVTEMIASPAAIRETRQSIQKAAWHPMEEPVSMQLVGCEPEQMAEAAKLSEDKGAAIIDINMGCPVRKVVNGDAGSALMRDVPLAARLIEATVKAVKVPVTVKMRMGWCHDSLNAPELARIAQDLGAQMITVHGRTRNQMYKGSADWALSPGQGSRLGAGDRQRRYLRRGGRGPGSRAERGRWRDDRARAYGRPWLLGQVMHWLQTGTLRPEP